MRKKWNVYVGDEEKIREFSSDPECRQVFHDPFLMKDMDKAVMRISSAVESGEKITVYGDYDVDGITATVLLMRSLQRLGARVDYYIPDRQAEGYGFHEPALRKLAAEGTKLLVSVDCGITSVEDVAAIHEELDIVITDHHLPGKELPKAIAIVNPHREDCRYPDKDLAGVGVAFKLCQALWKSMEGVSFAEDTELVALGTIADIVPLLGENRKLVKMGLKAIAETKFPGLQALIEVSGLQGREIGSGQIGFTLAPRLNAAGRIGSALEGVKLLLTEDRDEADGIAAMLNEQNLQRQQIERERHRVW